MADTLILLLLSPPSYHAMLRNMHYAATIRFLAYCRFFRATLLLPLLFRHGVFRWRMLILRRRYHDIQALD